MIIQRHEEMVYPAVRMLAGTAGGSGTVVYSQAETDGHIHTFVIGCYHVIEGLIRIKDEWDPRVGRNVKVERRAEATCEVFRYNRVSECVGVTGIKSKIVAYDVRKDLALLEMEDHETLSPYTAKLIPKDRIDSVLLSSELWAVGAALLHPPILTQGFLNFKDDIIEDETYWLSSANTIFGNSGGAVYWHDPDSSEYYFVGLPARISVSLSGFSATPITHMGFFIPPPSVYAFLEVNDYQFLYDPHDSYAQCATRRAEKLAKEQDRVTLIQGLIERKEG